MEPDYEKMLQGEDVIFFDCCGLSKNRDWFGFAVENFDSYGKINRPIIREEIEHGKKIFTAVAITEKERYFTPRVAQEVKDFVVILKNKQRYFESRLSFSKEGVEAQKLFAAIIKLHEIFDNILQSNIYPHIKDEKFKEYFKELTELSLKYKVKDLKYKSEEEKKQKKSRKKETWADEEIIAAAITHALTYKTPCSIITRDKDMSWLLRYEMSYMVDSGKHESEIETLSKYPVKIYDVLRGEIWKSHERIRNRKREIQDFAEKGLPLERIVLP